MRGEEHIMLTWEGLNSYVNFGIQDICYTGRTNPNENHCAHFVCHALGISHGGGDSACCDYASGSRGGVLIRVQELAAVTPWRAYFLASDPCLVSECLIYVGLTAASRSATDIPPGHVGFYLNGRVWHYENHPGFERVVSYPLQGCDGLSTFIDRYVLGSAHDINHQHGPCRLWMSGFPPGASFRERSAISRRSP